MATLPVILDVAADAGVVDLSEAITGGELERTIDGASTLTIDVHDPHRKLIRAKDMQRAIDLKYDGVWFRLVKLSKAGMAVTLTFEDRDVAYLRRHTKSRKVSRSKMTRAQFVRSLVREVRQSRIKFFCPEVNERQPIGKATIDAKPAKRTATDRADRRQKGLAGGAELKVSGASATSEQRRNAERCLDVADTLKAGPKATKALLEAVIVESGIRNLSYGDADSQGILQVRVSTSGSAARSRDIEWCVRTFLSKGFWGKGGAISLAEKNPGMSAGAVAQNTQGSAFPDRYDQVADEAQGFIDAYGGATGSDTGGAAGTISTRKRYEFSRGLAGKREDSWTAIQRLASEVNWRAFVDRGTLYFVSEDRLIAARAVYTLSEDTDGVSWIDFDIDQGKVDAEVRVQCRTELFDVRVGSVVAIREMGIANGRWLVASVRQNLFTADTELTLKARTPKLAEPETEITERTADSSGGKSSASGGDLSANTAVMRAHRKVDAIDKKNYAYAWGGGHSADMAGPYDCSGFVSAVLEAGGLLKGPQATPGLINWGELGEGNYMTVWVKENGNPHQSHTFMTFTLSGEGKGVQEFAEAGGADSSHTGWHKSRNKSGFVARHWPGT